MQQRPRTALLLYSVGMLSKKVLLAVNGVRVATRETAHKNRAGNLVYTGRCTGG